MEATTVIEQDPTATEEDPTPVEESQPAIFAYALYVDLPECETEEAKRGSCKDPDHFHAWVRLPNKFQHKDIRDHAMAARARRQRQLRDEDSDSRAILEDSLDTLREADKVDIVDEIVAREAGKYLSEAMKDIAEIEDESAEVGEGEDPVLLYAHIEKDQERLNELDALPEEERPLEEYEELVKHVQRYYDTVEERQRELEQPQREELMSREIEDLIGVIRTDRIESEGLQEYLHTYNSWAVVYGTLKADKSGRHFPDLNALKEQSPEVVDTLLGAFGALETGAREGNS